MTSYWLERALIGGDRADGVRVEERDGTITSVTPNTVPQTADIRLTGLTLPGFANAHSHAFHRALRGRTHADGGSFWSWRERMYAVADALTPEKYLALATAVFAEMALAGYTVVGEFHYVHHRAGGEKYSEPNAMAHALIAAAAAAGIRLTLLDTLYLRGGLAADGSELALSAEQARFGDGTAAAWAQRHAELSDSNSDAPTVRIGAAVHSVRAVPRAELADLRAATVGQPVHAHVSEQPAENDQANAAWGLTPIAVLADAGIVDSSFTAVHATHLTPGDIGALAVAGATACICPTTERDLGDGIGPVGDLLRAGVHLCIGSDQHAVIDPFDELRALEGHERLATLSRGRIDPQQLLAAGTTNGYRSLGWTGGAIAVGNVCDLVTVDDRSARTAGGRSDQVMFAAASADVTDTVVAGVRIVEARRHRLGDIGALLQAAIADVAPTEGQHA